MNSYPAPANALKRLAVALSIRPPALLAAMLATALAFASGVALLSLRYTRARDVAQHQLNAITEQRVNQLNAWREERLADGRFFSHARFVSEDVRLWLADPGSAAAPTAVADWLSPLQGENRYYEVMIFDARLERRLALPSDAREPTALERIRLAETLHNRAVTLTDLDRDAASERIYCDVLFPIFEGPDRQRPPIAVGLLRANVRASLFPILQQWPVPSETAETLLVRRDGEDVVFLNDLRHRANTALVLRESMSNAKLPAARVLRGETKPFEGVDYRGVPVVAVGRQIPGTPWVLVAKLDRREIYRAMSGQLLADSTALLAALLACGTLAAMAWQRHRTSLLRNAATEWERTFDSVPDLIAILDNEQRIVRVNRAMAERLGRAPADCVGTACFECVHATAAPPGDCPHLCTVVDRQPHSTDLFDQRLGGDFQINTAPLFDERGTMTGTVHVARDITERKRAEAALRESRQTALNLMADAVEARQQAEKAALTLRESESRYRSLFESIDAGFCVIEVLFDGDAKPVDYRFLEVNPAFEKQTGIVDATGKRMREIAPAHEEHWFDVYGRVAQTGDPVRFENHSAHLGRWYDVYAYRSGRPEERRVAVLFNDISKRRQVEERLRESEADFRGFFENVGTGTAQIDANGRFMRVNERYCEITGYRREELLGGMKPVDLDYPEDREADRERLEGFLGGKFPLYEAEKRYLRKDGTVVWVRVVAKFIYDELGRRRYTAAIIEDITERKRAETELAVSRQRIAGIVESAMDAIISIDEDQRIVLFNQAAEKIFRCPAAEAIGSLIDRFIPERFRQAHRGHVREFGKSGVTSRTMGRLGEPLCALRADGEEFPMEASISTVEVAGARLYTVILRDITERVRAEDSLKASLREKEVLLKEIHHRVKNNMQVLSSLVSLQAESLTDAPVLAALSDVRDRVRSMALVHEKLYQSQDLAAVDFVAYAKSLLDQLWNAHRSRATVNFKLELQPVTLTVDKAVPCGLILNELVSNALKHAFTGRSLGTVTVSTQTGPNGRVSLSVSDDGVGFPAGLDWKQANSLGLRLVQLLTRQLVGTVAARPSAAGGTEFEIEFVIEASM